MLWGQKHSWGALSIWVVLKSNKRAKLAVAFQHRPLPDWRRAGPRTASHQCCCSWEQLQLHFSEEGNPLNQGRPRLYWVNPLLIYTDSKSVSLSKISISLLNAYYEPIIWLSTIKKERKNKLKYFYLSSYSGTNPQTKRGTAQERKGSLTTSSFLLILTQFPESKGVN